MGVHLNWDPVEIVTELGRDELLIFWSGRGQSACGITEDRTESV